MVATVRLAPSAAAGLAVHPDGSRVYVSDPTQNTVLVVDVATSNVARRFRLEAPPGLMAIDPTGTQLYVTHPLAGGVSVIDTETGTVLHRVPPPAGTFPFRMVLPGGAERAIELPSGSGGVAVAASGARAYFTNVLAGTVKSGAVPRWPLGHVCDGVTRPRCLATTSRRG